MSQLPDQRNGSKANHRDQPPRYASEPFANFLERRQVAVLDVIRGASPDSRRLLVGDPGTGSVSYAVAVPHDAATATAVETEHEVLAGLVNRLRVELMETVPHVVERVDVTATLSGLVVTGVRGLRPPVNGRQESRTRSTLAAVDSWLAAVWKDTSGPSAPVDLGAGATASVLARYTGSARLAPALDSIQRARRKLAQFEVPLTLTHGCLCMRHMRTDDGAVIGVDDWGLASWAADPLRELGRFAVRVSDGRLPEVIAGRTSYAGLVRSFVTTGLERTELPRHLWREVLVLSQLELALEELERGAPEGITLLMTAVRALPSER